MKKVIKTENAPAPIGPYNQGILVDGTLYLSGQIAINPKNNEIVTSTIAAETKQVLDNLKAVVEAAGMTLQNVTKCTIFLSSMDHFGNVNKVYGDYFNKDAPARECVEVRRLPKDVNVEISAIAVKE